VKQGSGASEVNMDVEADTNDYSDLHIEPVTEDRKKNGQCSAGTEACEEPSTALSLFQVSDVKYRSGLWLFSSTHCRMHVQ